MRFFPRWLASVTMERQERRQVATAEGHVVRVLIARQFATWRADVVASRQLRLSFHRAEVQFSRWILARYATVWRSHAAIARRSRACERLAGLHWADLLKSASMGIWRRYIAYLHSKRHEIKVRRCVAHIAGLRYRRIFNKWQNVHGAGVQFRHALTLRAAQCMRGVFVWGEQVRQRKNTARRVQAMQSRHRQIVVLHRWKRAYNSAELCKCRVHRGLLGCIMGWWQCILHSDAQRRTQQVAQGWLLQRYRLQRFGFLALYCCALLGRELREKALLLAEAIDHGISRDAQEASAWSMERLWQQVEESRQSDAVQSQICRLQQLRVFLALWMKFIQQQQHKYSVHLLCDRYRVKNLLHRTLKGWRIAQARLSCVAEAVLLWAAGLATRQAIVLLEGWRHLIKRRCACQKAVAQIKMMKHRRPWNTWLLSVARKRQVTEVLACVALEQLHELLSAWREFAAQWAIRRKRESISVEVLRQSRQRYWVDQWCVARRWHRLRSVAETWDSRVLGRRLRTTAFRGWKFVFRRSKGAEQAAAILSRRCQRVHIRGWSRLLRTVGVPNRACVVQALAWWRLAHARGVAQRESFIKMWRGYLALAFSWWQSAHKGCATRRAAACKLRTWVVASSFKRFNQSRKEQAKERHTLLEQCRLAQRQRLKHSIVAWRQRAAKTGVPERQGSRELCHRLRLRRLQAGFAALRRRAQRAKELHVLDDGAAVPAAHSAKATKVVRWRQKKIVASWIEAHLWHRVLDARTMDTAAAGARREARISLTRSLLAAWRTRSKEKMDSRALANLVRSRCGATVRSDFFDRWVRAYEFESSAFYASKILGRWKASRIMGAWLRFAGVRKRFNARVAHAQVLRDTQMMRQSFACWDEHVREHRSAAAVWLERWQYWGITLISAWKTVTRELQLIRGGLAHFRKRTRWLRLWRAATEKRGTRLKALHRASFHAFARWTQKSIELRGRCEGLQKRVAAGRQLRRLCSWAICTREHSRQACPTEVQAHAFLAWVTQHRRDVAVKRRMSMMDARRLGGLLLRIMIPWFAKACEGRSLRAASRTYRARRRARETHHGLATLRRYACFQSHRRGIVLSHRAAWDQRAVLRPCMTIWWQAAWCARAFARLWTARSQRGCRNCWRAWRFQTEASESKRRCGVAFRRLHLSHLARRIVSSWSVHTGHIAAAKQLVSVLGHVWSKRWVGEKSWRTRATSDSVLQAMFCRFALAFDNRRAEVSPHGNRSFAQGEAFQALVSMIWARQQLSVALGRLKGYPQPWVLGSWPVGSTPLLHRGSPYYLQAEMRLEAMTCELQADVPVEAAPTTLWASCAAAAAAENGRPLPRQRALMWQTFADLMVVNHPGWPTQTSPLVGTLAQQGLAALAAAPAPVPALMNSAYPVSRCASEVAGSTAESEHGSQDWASNCGSGGIVFTTPDTCGRSASDTVSVNSNAKRWNRLSSTPPGSPDGTPCFGFRMCHSFGRNEPLAGISVPAPGRLLAPTV